MTDVQVSRKQTSPSFHSETPLKGVSATALVGVTWSWESLKCNNNGEFGV